MGKLRGEVDGRSGNGLGLERRLSKDFHQVHGGSTGLA